MDKNRIADRLYISYFKPLGPINNSQLLRVPRKGIFNNKVKGKFVAG